jgi:site-specific recombinase XerD
VTSFLSAGPRSRPSPRRSRITKKGIARLLEYGLLANARLDAVTTEKISGYIRRRQDAGLKVSSVNRELQVLR